MKAVAAVLALAGSVAAGGYPVYSTSSMAPVYPTSTEYPVYPSSTPCEESSSSPIYPSSTPCEESVTAPIYPTSSEYPVYPVSSSYPAPVYYTTKIVTSMTSYCSEATTVTYCGTAYTVESADYITVTDCPCTVSLPVYSYSAVYPSNTTTPCETPVYSTSTYAPVVTAGANKVAGALAGGVAAALGAVALL